MKILKVIRDNNFVQIKHEVQGYQAVEERDIKAHEAPLKSFDDALQALAPVVVKLLEYPPSSSSTIVIKSISVSHTTKGTRSVGISFRKKLNATGNYHPMSTPMVQFDDAAEGEGNRKEVHASHAALIDLSIAEAIRYSEGERQQALLPLDDVGSPVSPADGDELRYDTAPAGDDGEDNVEKFPPAKKKAPAKKTIAKA